MYKVYINQTAINLISETDLSEKTQTDETHLIVPYPGKTKFLFHYLDKAEKSTVLKSITIYHKALDQLVNDFESLFTIIEAGGGLVFNTKKETLLIFRRGYWDLPKGKIDLGETKEAAAVREVQEETGIQNVQLGKFLIETNHIYRDKSNKRCIKRTYWYEMHSTATQLVPQTEEDIEIAKWMPSDHFLANNYKTYPTIKDVFAAYFIP